MQKAELENKLNQTDAEFALSLAEANDGSFPFDKERVEKYFDLKAQKVSFSGEGDFQVIFLICPADCANTIPRLSGPAVRATEEKRIRTECR